MKKIAEYPCYSHEPSIGNEDLEKERTIDEPTAATVGPAGDVAEGAGTFAVRETRRLYRLKAGRQMAVVAVDTEDEARSLAATHDPFGADWRNPEVTELEFEETAEAHIFGDVVFTSLALPTPAKRTRRS